MEIVPVSTVVIWARINRTFSDPKSNNPKSEVTTSPLQQLTDTPSRRQLHRLHNLQEVVK
jgi:hypothetical protein